MTPNDKTALVRTYFERLTASDTDGIVRLFEDDAHVISPFLGKMHAAEFFEKLGNASDASKLTVFDVLLGENGDSAAAHFEYDWTLKSGEQFVFQGVDYFKFGESGRFASMSIFYDTHPVREDVGDKYALA
ncbi:nuclear transport factor 2 family protein [Flavimaricola marinus]|uniref:Steroid Delta-isomerase n=1 Tax=Flavimaricola marinus TaxID=1819565 RepID=A0A238LAS7_9RHOB|nr:nuclear transport factor 2 family protein [Flavimaricola marinus]SMY06779.1 Steroid Delta-isomerase [Flavimaricola marinus]